MALVTVVGFRFGSPNVAENVTSTLKATAKAIAEIGAAAIPETAEEVEEELVDRNGFYDPAAALTIELVMVTQAGAAPIVLEAIPPARITIADAVRTGHLALENVHTTGDRPNGFQVRNGTGMLVGGFTVVTRLAPHFDLSSRRSD
jgi:hypothetical protein